MRHPSVRTPESVADDIDESDVFIDGAWIPARPQASPGTLAGRFRAAWLVFTGRADALVWPGGQ